MKKVLLIALALISCFAAEAQLPIIKPSGIYKISNGLYYGMADYVDNIVASSTLKPQGRANYRADNIFDRDPKTAWVEGVKGYGIGQWIEFRNVCVVRGSGGDYARPVRNINILNGYVKSDKAWRENGRVKRLKVYCNGKPKYILELQNSRSLQAFNVDLSKGANIRFEILDVYPGTKYQDTVISEIAFDACY